MGGKRTLSRGQRRAFDALSYTRPVSHNRSAAMRDE
jgi:hypothetical protein